MRPQTTLNFKVRTKAGTPAWLVRFEVESFRALKAFGKLQMLSCGKSRKGPQDLKANGEELDPRVQVIQILHNTPKKFQV